LLIVEPRSRNDVQRQQRAHQVGQQQHQPRPHRQHGRRRHEHLQLEHARSAERGHH